MNKYTDEERVDIADKEYTKYKVGNPVQINRKKTTIGYVSKVIDDPKTGLQAYIVTDVSAKIAKLHPEKVKEVTVLYRGSTEPFKGEGWVEDWLKNDIPMGEKLFSGSKGATKQLQAASDTLQQAMNTYVNAQFEVYGHSLASMNVQYALANLEMEQYNRFCAAYVYEGPNIYGVLSRKQQQTVDQLKNKIFNYVDHKDLATLRYEKGRPTVGTVIHVDSKDTKSITSQHMWGGYRYDAVGRVLMTNQNKQDIELMQARALIQSDLDSLDRLEAKLRASGGGLSQSEKIYLDSERAAAVTRGIAAVVEEGMAKIKSVAEQAIERRGEKWQQAQVAAHDIGCSLTDGDVRNCLAEVGATDHTMIAEPCDRLETEIEKAQKIQQSFEEKMKNIQSGIEKMVQTDQELARELNK